MGKLAGLTGLYCAGKNYAAALLEKRGLPALDVDKLGYQAILAEEAAIVRRFGTEVTGPGGLVDRRLLGSRVFGDRDALAALEAIIHPVVNRMISEWIDRQTAPACVINAALLHKSFIWNRLDALIVVGAPLPVRLLRARKRDSLPLVEILRRFKAQRDFPRIVPGQAQFFSGPSDIYTVWNSGFPGSRRFLEKRIERIVSKLTG